MPASWIFLASGLFRVCAVVCRLVPAGDAVSGDPRTHSGRESGPGSGARDRRLFTDGHGRGPRRRTGHGPGPAETARARLDVHGEAERAFPCVRPARPVSPGRGGRGKAGAVMARVAVRESVTLAGRAERARAARSFVSEVLGPGHPCGDVAVLLVSEIFGNSSGTPARVLPGRRSRSRSGPGTASSGLKSPTEPGRGRRSCVLPAVMRKAVAGFSLLRASRRGGAGDGAAGGR
jgi:hypothetical protein